MDERIKAVQKMQSYIEEHILEDIKIDDLAKLTKYSPVHVRRLFMEWTKLSPSDYIRRLKLTKAALMLRDESCMVHSQNKKPYDFSPSNARKVMVQRIHKSARKVIIKRGIKATDYWSYCNEIGCDVWGLLKSIRSISEEPVGLWLPVQYRNPISNEYVQGVEVERDYKGTIPGGFEMIDFPEADYLLFRSEPYDDEDYGSAILDVEKVISEYDFHGNGYIKDENNPRIQLEPICTRGYIELVPVICRDTSS